MDEIVWYGFSTVCDMKCARTEYDRLGIFYIIKLINNILYEK